MKTCIHLSEIQKFPYSDRNYYSCKINWFYFHCPLAVTIKQTTWTLQSNLYHRQKWGYKPLKYSSFGSLFKSSYPAQYFRVNYIMVMMLLITLYLLHVQKKSIISLYLYLYSLLNENFSIILHIEEKLQKKVNCLPTWYFISEAKTLTYATTIKMKKSKLHKIKPYFVLWAIKQTKPDFKSC